MANVFAFVEMRGLLHTKLNFEYLFAYQINYVLKKLFPSVWNLDTRCYSKMSLHLMFHFYQRPSELARNQE